MKTIFVLLMFMITISVHAHIYVVCVGVSDYPGQQNDLRVSANDALVIKKIFDANGHADVNCLINKNATVANVVRVVSETFAKARKNDVVLFFFSGHGIQGGFVCQDGFLYYRDVVKEMMRSSAKTKIVLADACYSGKMRSSGNNFITNVYDDKNVMFFLSSRTTEKSLETKYANSLFSIFLERGLRGGADTNLDRVVTAKELYNFVHNGVVRKSKGMQHPVMWGNFDKNMSVIKW
jgi:uncharacterized caspase-like protein